LFLEFECRIRNEGIISAAQISALGRAERVDGGYPVTDEHFQVGSAARRGRSARPVANL
jgi:hypothetical protein